MSAPTRRSRSSSRTTDVLYITAGDPRRRTGGNIYARHMIAALRRDGIGARTLALDARSARSLRDQRARVAIVDTIATNLAAPRLRALRTRGTRVIALVLMSQGAQVLARRADRTVVPSVTLARELVAAGISRASISVIAPGKNASTPSSGKSAGRVLCVANWSPAKGIHTLVSAIASVPGATLDLVGDADGAYAARVRRLLVRHGLASRVRVHGNLGGAALERRYRSATAFVLPSVRESYGMALASALAYGLPSIACDIPATREVAGDAALLVAPGRVGPLADALRSLTQDRQLRDRLRSRALRRARSFPTWRRSEAAFVRLVRAELAR
ncbi:MAG: glycosyltransferase [Chloroflexi bacterium]|nr:MAG: glycosyltransferase [Chloroflexota bacterium]